LTRQAHIHSFALIVPKATSEERLNSGRRRSPEIISHRGAHQTLPENSIPAFLRAIELGAQAIELDVHGTSDGVLVVHHDAEMNAPGLPPRRIALLSATDVRKLRLDHDIEIPTLAEVLDAIRGDVTVYVEIKAPAIEPLVVREIREHNVDCAIHSFDHRIVKTVKSIFPVVRTGVLQVARHVDPIQALIATGAEDLWQEVSFIDEELVSRAHSIDARVIAWTANEPEHWETLRRIGVDGICTDLIAELATFKW
jgi:glycerophosphoryl diester phosphodiesterase